MPRGVPKVIDFDSQINTLDRKIEKLKAERQEVLGKKRMADLQTLTVFMTEKGISADDVITMLSPAVAASAQSAPGEV